MKEQEERLDNREKELKEKESKINKSVSDEVGDIRDKLEKIPIQTQLTVCILVGTTLYSFLITIFQGFNL